MQFFRSNIDILSGQLQLQPMRACRRRWRQPSNATNAITRTTETARQTSVKTSKMDSGALSTIIKWRPVGWKCNNNCLAIYFLGKNEVMNNKLCRMKLICIQAIRAYWNFFDLSDITKQ
ncbi:hypothetical protein SS50377_27877 [Spironucleus salmonicida]|uniref:Uncharacterized protein n=1 Tax=Spironucleus salmonicida TaxID=348837 RepID=V6LX41_9EUKA|nr:hypothetical protein SS50377_27877 [Spironucleus salmonicida]|eukprot:EST48808.1 Hypothetical protein SS50377_10903 [Spironucleus salmonicida]